MVLTAEQLDAIDRGETVREIVEGREIVVLGADVFSRLQLWFDDSDEVDREAVARLIDRNMAEDDANDPGLDSYQIYKR